ncbi:unnamed protein product [Chironomus riparius]|uniref:Ionotropic glutamate receptor C-terminal domain-containing protein n=1 Tax=Chironomus riparius TaxID=315576 RepID=A0A9N9S962_9DIPT|nr:unnamed protein product [Chironomus riparius]
MELHEKVDHITMEIVFHAFFIINEDHFVTLATIEWFGNVCNQAQLTRVNKFNKITKKWTKKLQNYEKFTKFHGCELFFQLPVKHFGFFFWGHAIPNRNYTSFETFGLTPQIFEILSKKYDFKPKYSLCYVKDAVWFYTFDNLHTVPFHINSSYTNPTMSFYVQGLTDILFGTISVSNLILDVKFTIYTTPADVYTPYEKLLLPFDTETWILLFVTFVVTILSIFIINRLSKGTQNIVYGKRVENPIWNVISIFFGISQTKLPTTSFPRFILILFIVFCLIFRTCFQSKSYEFMTTKPRRAPPKTQQDLIDMNYEMVTVFSRNGDEEAEPLIYSLIKDEKESILFCVIAPESRLFCVSTSESRLICVNAPELRLFCVNTPKSTLICVNASESRLFCVNAPESRLICVNAPESRLFCVNAPELRLFCVNAPKSKLFCVNAPESRLFCVNAPESRMFCVSAPESKLFYVYVPEPKIFCVNALELRLFCVNAPESKIFYVNAPESSLFCVIAPESRLICVNAPESRLICVNAPELRLFCVNTPKSTLICVNASESRLFCVKAPESRLFCVNAPESRLFCVNAPELRLFCVNAPESRLFCVNAPELRLFCVNAPESSLFCVNAPESRLFCVNAPESRIFCVSAPESKLFYVPPIKVVDSNEMNSIIHTQSQNSTAKISLIVDDFTRLNIEVYGENNWNKFSKAFFVDHVAIGYRQTAFYARILKDTVNRLVETGVVKYLIQTNIFYYELYKTTELGPEMLSLNDLSFGFNIFLGFCGISGLAFVMELILAIRYIHKSNCFRRKSELRKINENIVDLNAQALQDIADTFLVKQNLPFNVIIFTPFSDNLSIILTSFLSKSQESFSYNLEFFPGIPQPRFLKRPAIIFVESVDILTQYLNAVGFIRYGNNPILFFIFIANSTFFDIENSKIVKNFPKISKLTASIFYHAFFIIIEDHFVTLATVEWFGNVCNQPQLTRVNTFNKITKKWTKKLQNYEKFMNFQGCQLVKMLPMNYQSHNNDFYWGYAAKKHNFTAVYQPTKIADMKWLETFNPETITYLAVNNTFNEPNVVYFVYSASDLSHQTIRMTNTFEEVRYLVITTPADAYTAYEKLLLPFDYETWILLLVTFILTILSILIINRLSKSSQNIVYGKQVENPMWNVISIFFGISQTKLPTENFSRFILTLFIVFCLIFRTCFQSKSFEFMTSEPRRAPPKTPQDLIDMSYSIMVFNVPESSKTATSLVYNLVMDEKDKWPSVKPLKYNEDDQLVQTQSQNSSAKIALIVDDIMTTFYDTQNIGQNPWNQLDDRFFSTNIGIATQHSSFYFRMIKDTVDKLTDTGITTHLIKTRVLVRRKYPKDESEPMILRIDDLLFGFNIFLGFCIISGLIFVVELILGVKCCRKNLSLEILCRKLKSKKVKYAKIHPMSSIEGLIFSRHRRSVVDVLRQFKIKKKHLVKSQGSQGDNNIMSPNLSQLKPLDLQ